MNINDFEVIVGKMEMLQDELKLSDTVKNKLLGDLAEFTIKSIANVNYLGKVEATFNKLKVVDTLVEECQADLDYFVSLLSENPN